MILLDTTVLVYAVGAEHPLREPARQIINEVASGDRAATTTIEVIQEFAHVRARRPGRSDAAALSRHYAGLLQPLVIPSEEDLRVGLELFEEYAGIGAFDAVLAAVARRHGLEALVTADRAFTTIPGLHVRLLSPPA